MSSFDNEIAANDYETIASLAEDLVYRLPGCADMMVRKAIRSTYRDFCRRTCSLVSSRRIELSANETCYMVHPKFVDCLVDCVISVENGSRELTKDEYWLTDCVLHVTPRVLPNAEGERSFLSVRCVEIPKLSSESVPSDFVQRYGDAITSGVLMRLLSMGGRSWSDPGQAALEARAYENALTETRVRHHAGGATASGGLNFIGRNNVL